jgi:hypothetical protein
LKELKNYNDLSTLSYSSINPSLIAHIKNKVYHLYINLSKSGPLDTFSFDSLGPILILEKTDYISLEKDIFSFTWNNEIASFHPEWCHELIFSDGSFFNLCIIHSPHHVIDMYLDAKYLSSEFINTLKVF